MITVTFATGVRVTYNEARHITWWLNNAGATLRDKADGRVIAHVGLNGGAILEWRTPCEVTAPPVATARHALQVIVTELNAKPITGWEEERLLCDLKAKLARFNARKKVWR